MADGQHEQVVLLDISNSFSVFGVLIDGQVRHQMRLSTVKERTADELAALLLPLWRSLGLKPRETSHFMVSSVVPPLNPVIRVLAEQYFEAHCVLIGPGIRTGMPIRYDNPAEVGADRIVNSVAARELYGAPVVVVDFDTATTFDVVSAHGEYVGGVIAPGISISAEALFANASKLSRVDLDRPDRLIGRNTAGAIQSGVYFGSIGLVDGILERLFDEIEGLQTVVATGTQASLIGAGSKYISEVDTMLTLHGLRMVHELNRAKLAIR